MLRLSKRWFLFLSRRDLLMRGLVLFSILAMEWFPVFAADDPTVSNRSPQTGEVDYFPQDGETLSVNPPGFVWLPEENAASYILQCSSHRDFSKVEYEKKDIPLNVHCPSAPLDTGTWYWRYAFVTQDGKTAAWSRVRAFTVPGNVPSLPQPTIVDLLSRLPTQHPKLFIRPENVRNLRQTLEKNYRQLWTDFLAHADRLMETPVIRDEPPPYPSGELNTNRKEDIDVWRSNRVVVVKAVEHAANLAFAYLLTDEKKYGLRAREWMLAVVAWPPEGTTGYRLNDECAMPILSEISRAYTWAYSALSEEDRRKIVSVMTVRGREVYRHLRESSHHTVRPFGSHNNRAWHYLGETAIAFIHEIPEAKTWLEYAMDVFFNVYPVWGDKEGGWHEGIAYWRSYLERITGWMQILQDEFGIDGYKKPYFQHAGEFPLYVNPPGTDHAGFGDGSDRSPASANAALMKELGMHVGKPLWMWYAVNATGESPPKEPTYEHLLRIRPFPVVPGDPRTAPPSKIFHGVGIASLHLDLSRPSTDIHFLFKSSPWGRQSHGYNAQNSFILYAYGKPVLLPSGSREWHGSPHHTDWMWETFSDNCITVNGQGQKKNSATARGKIVGELLEPEADYVAGDAVEAYEGRLNRFVRHVFFVKPDIFLIVDELEAPEPASFQYYLHAVEPFAVKNQYEIEARNGAGGVRIIMATPSQAIVTQTTGCVPAPIGLDLKQWNLQFETKDKVAKTCFINLMRVHPTQHGVNAVVNYGYKGNMEVHGFILDTQNLALVSNPTRKDFTIGMAKSDASWFLIVESRIKDQEFFVLAADATYVELMGKMMEKSEKRQAFYVPWHKIAPLVKPK